MTPATLVMMHVGDNASQLVSTLAPHWGAMDLSRDPTGLADLFEQAGQLASAVDDYEEAAREAGWEKSGDVWTHPEREEAETNPQNACYASGIEPNQREVSEYWIVSAMLADKLIAHGEKVEKDFAGLCIWARCRLGTLTDDPVIVKIAAEWN